MWIWTLKVQNEKFFGHLKLNQCFSTNTIRWTSYEEKVWTFFLYIEMAFNIDDHLTYFFSQSIDWVEDLSSQVWGENPHFFHCEEWRKNPHFLVRWGENWFLNVPQFASKSSIKISIISGFEKQKIKKKGFEVRLVHHFEVKSLTKFVRDQYSIFINIICEFTCISVCHITRIRLTTLPLSYAVRYFANFLATPSLVQIQF